MSDELDEMWAALSEHQPASEYADAWATMLNERTVNAAVVAAWAAGPAAWAASRAAKAAAGATLAATRAANAARRATAKAKGVK